MSPHISLEEAAWKGDSTAYRRLDIPAPKSFSAEGRNYLAVEEASLSALSAEAFHDISFYLRSEHLDKLRALALDDSASAAERFVASSLLRNAVIAAEGSLPLCQDTGTATAYAWKGQDTILSGRGDAALSIAQGAAQAWATHALRHSLLLPSSMLEEANSRSNLPAQVEVFSSPDPGLRLLFVAKGGGSSNKTLFFQETPALLSQARLRDFLRAHIRELGVAACPPYRLAIVVGGTSPELCLTVLKLASAGALDGLESGGENADKGIFRCPEWEGVAMEAARDSGLGAQLGGKNLALDCRVIRLPRHAASCPVAIGVSCNAHRNARARVSQEGFFLERLERSPDAYLRGIPEGLPAAGTRVDLDAPREAWLATLRALEPGDLVLLSGSIAVARDAAHARVQARLDLGEAPPAWMMEHPVCYAGPSRTPQGMAIGSFGPTTAGRMDTWAPGLMDRGASLVTMAKGNRSAALSASCARNGGVYLGMIGGAAALIAKEHILSERVIEYPELGMEAVRLVSVRDLPAFVIVSSRGSELYPR